MVFEAPGQFCLTGVWQTPVVSVRYRSGLLGGSLWLWGWVWFNPLIQMGEVPGINFRV